MKPSRLLILAALATLTSAPLLAQSVTFGSALAPAPSSLATARYRLSNTNWDIGILNQGTLSATSTVTQGLGNVSELTSDTFDFKLEYRVGQGLIWSLTNANPSATPAGGTVAWGSGFSPALPGSATIASSLTNSTGGSTTFPTTFNYIGFSAQANTNPASTISVSNVVFTGASSSGTAPSLASYSGTTTDFGSLLADQNLGGFDWILAGKVTAIKNVTSSDEGVVLNLRLAQVVIPEPGTYAALLGLASLGVVQLRRMRRRTA